MTPPVGIVSKVRHATLCTNSPYNFLWRTPRQKKIKLYMKQKNIYILLLSLKLRLNVSIYTTIQYRFLSDTREIMIQFARIHTPFSVPSQHFIVTVSLRVHRRYCLVMEEGNLILHFTPRWQRHSSSVIYSIPTTTRMQGLFISAVTSQLTHTLWLCNWLKWRVEQQMNLHSLRSRFCFVVFCEGVRQWDVR